MTKIAHIYTDKQINKIVNQSVSLGKLLYQLENNIISKEEFELKRKEIQG